MEKAIHHAPVVRFATFEIDLQAGEVRKGGLKLKLSGQPFQVLAILLEQPGAVVTRDELQKRLWPDTFVDVDHNLNTAINKIREALGDSAENPRFVETLPRRGYRFIAPIDGSAELSEKVSEDGRRKSDVRLWAMRWWILVALVVLLSGGGLLFYRTQHVAGRPVQRALTRLTFDDGLQVGATWSPDGRFIAYSSNRGGKFDIWVQQVSGGNPVQITTGPGQHWQPDWSPDGKYVAYRSEEGEGGLYLVPALGGAERKIASFGYYPRWSPDSSQILFNKRFMLLKGTADQFYLADLEGNPAREILADSLSGHGSQKNGRAFSAAWHPDGKGISVRAGYPAPNLTFWTIPIAGGAPTSLEIAPQIAEQLKEVSLGPGTPEGAMDFKFSWAPSGRAIYFESTFRGARNIWRMSVDPHESKAVAIERLTTGPGPDTEPSVSLDGKKLAFTGESRHIREWMFPFDATRGRISGVGQPVTSPVVEAWRHDLSRDGKELVFVGVRGGKVELWQKSLVDGWEAPILSADSYWRHGPQWSPDGSRVAYARSKLATGESQITIWSTQSRTEAPVTTLSKLNLIPSDWSPDGESLLVSRISQTSRAEVWQVPLAASPHAETAARKLVSGPDYDLYQSHFSGDARWVVFEAVRKTPTNLESRLYVTSATGGPWIRMTEGKPWDDKPRWSPDGKTIYFISRRGGVFNVWGIHFDPAKGKRVGEPFRVTSFTNPGPLIPDRVVNVELSLTEDKLVLTMEERSGGIWMLDNIDQ